MRVAKKEEAKVKRMLLTTIRAAALARNQYWTAAAWLHERKFPDEYSKAERQREERGDGDAPRIVLGVVAQLVQEKLPGFGDAQAKGAEPWLFADAAPAAGTTGLEPAGTAAKTEAQTMERWRGIAGLDDEE